MTDYPNDHDVTYTYDNDTIGTLSEVQDGMGKTSYFYDQRLRQIREEKEIDGMAWKTDWTYDAADRLKSVKYPDGEIVSYSYNTQGEIESLDTIISNIDYNEFHKIVSKQFVNGVKTDLHYNDDDFRLNRIYTTELQDFRYDYDDAGNILSIDDQLENTQYQ